MTECCLFAGKQRGSTFLYQQCTMQLCKYVLGDCCSNMRQTCLSLFTSVLYQQYGYHPEPLKTFIVNRILFFTLRGSSRCCLNHRRRNKLSSLLCPQTRVAFAPAINI